MKKMIMFKMNLGNLTSTILILTSFFCVQSAPAKPLNERSTELTWQAWLLVDDQNQNKQYDPDGLIRRKITPKSVFIAPTFSPESLPACADGYTSDPMGRCIKIIQLDTDAHLNFILDRLKQQFGNYDEYEDDVDESLPTPGPFQFNIPLGEVEKDDRVSEEDTNVAIVVAPTNGSFNLRNDSIKVNSVKRDNSTSQVDAPIIITKINIAPEETTTSTEAETTTLETTTTEMPTTMLQEETTTQSENVETTTFEEETPTLSPEPQAIFFKIPENNSTKVNDSELVASENKHHENYVRFPEGSEPDLIKHPEQLQEQQPPQIEIKNRFRDDTEQIISQLLPHAKINTKFDTTEKLFEDYIRGTEMDDRLFKNRDTVHQEVNNHNQQPSQRVYNHRNRDKWLFPPTWRDSPPQKPLVLRFNNLGANKHTNHFYQHHPRQEPVYREVPPEDLSYIFGFKRGSAHR